MSDSTVRIFGNVGKLEAQYTPKGKYVLKGSVGVNHGKGNNKVTNWFNFVAWAKTGEFMNQICKVGTWVCIEGDLLLREWSDKEGVKHISPDVTVREFKVLARGKGNEEQESGENEPEFMQD